ncbi:site-2 protease family protein [Aestuariivirga sp.]|uniref:site-2 protease family protein n=1 Tax=Aestuariivirga sp. TaxID=2650926 RepID=UPI0039E4F03B
MYDQELKLLALFLGLPAGFVIGSVVHEFGHALAALAMGRRVYQITIGRRRLMLKANLGFTWLYIGSNPVSGYVLASAPKQDAPWANRFFLLSGLLANTALMFSAGTLGIFIAGAHEVAAALLYGIAVAQGVMILVNTIPTEYWQNDGSRLINDGLRLWRSFFPSKYPLPADVKDSVEAMIRPYAASGNVDLLSRRSLEEILDVFYSLHCSIPTLPLVMRAVLEPGENAQPLLPAVECFLIDHAATNWLFTEDRHHLIDMDRLTARGMEIGASLRAMRQTRASILVELGRYKEAIALFLSTADVPNSPFEDALVSYFLARAHAGTADLAQAEKYLEKLSALAASPDASPRIAPLAEKARKVIDAAAQAVHRPVPTP